MFAHSAQSEFEKFRSWSHEAVQLFFEPLSWVWRGVRVVLDGLLVIALEHARPREQLLSKYILQARDTSRVDPRFAATVKDLILRESRDRAALMKSACSLVFILDQNLSTVETECLEDLYQTKTRVLRSPREREILQHLVQIGFVEISSEKAASRRKNKIRDQVQLSEAGAIYLAMLQQERRKGTSIASSLTSA